MELENHRQAGSWILVDRSEAGNKPVFKPRVVYKYKYHADGTFDKAKVRITTAAFSKRLKEGVDYEAKYAATPMWVSHAPAPGRGQPLRT